jgi:CBS-domain-containing membrane protein
MSWTVADVMTKEPVTVGPVTSFKACVDLMRIHDVSAIPVVITGDRLVGIVSESDLLAREARRTVDARRTSTAGKVKALTAAGLMTADVVTTTASAPLAAAASLMFQHRVKVLPVVDSDHRLIGMISRAQVLKVFLRSDESIRREIARGLVDIPKLDRARVDVEVLNGVVHLRGVVETVGLSDRMRRLAVGTPGVVGVVSHLTLAGELAVAAVSGADDGQD